MKTEIEWLKERRQGARSQMRTITDFESMTVSELGRPALCDDLAAVVQIAAEKGELAAYDRLDEIHQGVMNDEYDQF